MKGLRGWLAKPPAAPRDEYAATKAALIKRFEAMVAETRSKEAMSRMVQAEVERSRFIQTAKGPRLVIPGHRYRVYYTYGSYATYMTKLDHAGKNVVFTPVNKEEWYGRMPPGPGLLEEHMISDIEFDEG